MSTMSQEDVDVLRHAKDTLENPRLGTKITHLIGLPLERVMRQLPNNWLAAIQRATERSLVIALDAALATVEMRYSPSVVHPRRTMGARSGISRFARPFPRR